MNEIEQARAAGYREGIEAAAKWHDDMAAELERRVRERDGNFVSGMHRVALAHREDASKLRVALAPAPAETPTTLAVEMGDGWGAWATWQGDGGYGCPLPAYMRPEVRYRSGGTTEVQAGLVRWTHTGAWDDIVAYRCRIVQPSDAGAPVAPDAYTPLQRMKMDLDAITDASVVWKDDHVTMENLRSRFAWLGDHDEEETGQTEFKLIEARIAALEAEVAARREAQAKTAEYLDSCIRVAEWDSENGANELRRARHRALGDLRRARALLQGQGGADAG